MELIPFPLPTGDFPDELRTCSVHRTTITLPLHKAIVDGATTNGSSRSLIGFCGPNDSQCGCAAEILQWSSETGELLYSGDFLFQVQHIERSAPFRVAQISRLESTASSAVQGATSDTISYQENLLIQELLDSMATYAEQMVQSYENMSPLEESLVESTSNSVLDRLEMTQELAAIVAILRSSLEQWPPSSLPYLAVDLTSTNNEQRWKLLSCASLSDQIELARSILVDALPEVASSKPAQELQVGTPQLPRWASTIRKGVELEYFWNEEYEWCRGVVVEDPVFIVDEWILTVHFDDDDSTHRLPLSADEAARWRPAPSFG